MLPVASPVKVKSLPLTAFIVPPYDPIPPFPAFVTVKAVTATSAAIIFPLALITPEDVMFPVAAFIAKVSLPPVCLKENLLPVGTSIAKSLLLPALRVFTVTVPLELIEPVNTISPDIDICPPSSVTSDPFDLILVAEIAPLALISPATVNCIIDWSFSDFGGVVVPIPTSPELDTNIKDEPLEAIITSWPALEFKVVLPLLFCVRAVLIVLKVRFLLMEF